MPGMGKRGWFSFKATLAEAGRRRQIALRPPNTGDCLAEPLDRLTAALADRYRIERELGAGGMATVYLAQDLRHDRKVAIKVLRPELAAVIGAERFLSEIKTTANLQHPHILALHDSGQADSFLFYVMPYVAGESLRERLTREKQLPIADAVRIAAEVAGALDYAHRQGVVHRDIKPENILLHDGRALVADFGIALAASSAGGRMTETGMSLGTPTYMSPEQAMGERVLDARADVYALGCVVYEMLTGEPPFSGPTAQAIVAKVMTEKPVPPTRMRETVPPHVEAAVLAALAKLPADRFATAAQFAEALATPGAPRRHLGVTGAAAGPAPWRTAALVLSVLAAAATALAVWALTRPAPEGAVSRFALVMGDSTRLRYSNGVNEPPRLALSPDGRELVYVGDVGDIGRHGLYLRAMDRLEARLLPGTDSAVAPAISPDGAQVAFVTGERSGRPALKIVSLRGGPPITVLQGGIGSNPAWGTAGNIYFIDDQGRTIRRVAASGGPAEDVVRLADADSGTRYRYIHLLPGGRAALVTAFPAVQNDEAGYALRAVDLATGKFGATMPGIAGVYSTRGHVVYVTYGGTLMAQGFDPETLTATGRPVALVEGLDVRIGGFTDLSMSETGTLAYVTLGLNAAEDFVWVTQTGELTVVDPEWTDIEFEDFDLSPDGTRLAVGIVGARTDIWVKQLDRGPKSRLTFGGLGNVSPAWTADGQYVSFVSRREGRAALWRRRADGVGSEELVTDLGRDIVEARWTRDGAWLLVSVAGPPSLDLYAMRLGVDSNARPLLAEPYDEGLPALSPDGRWLAYVSAETGDPQVFVRPFPAVQEGKWQISTAGGDAPVWSPDGRELIFRGQSGPDGRELIRGESSDAIFSVDMTRGPGQATPRRLLQLPAETQFETNQLRGRMFEVSRDGRRYLLVRQGGGDESGDLVIVQNFFRELRAAPAAGREPE
jgi:serine/threonine-protein kinase